MRRPSRFGSFRLMRLHRLILLVGSTALVSCTFYAQPPPGWDVMEREFTAEAVLKDALEQSVAEGDPVEHAQDLMASVSVVPHGADVPEGTKLDCIVLWRKPDFWSLEQHGGGHDVKFVGRGAEGVEIDGGKVTRTDVLMDEILVDRFLRHLFLLRYFKDGAGEPAWIDETVKRPDGYALRIAKFDVHGRKWVLSLDAQTLEPIAVREWVRLPDDTAGALDTFFDSFATDELGNRVPKQMRSYSNGELVQEMTLKDLAWNRGLRDVDFKVEGIR